MEQFTLKGKNIVITGASSGIGKVCAVECAKMGATVILLGRDTKRLKEVEGEIDALGTAGDYSSFSIDLSENLEGLTDIIDEAVQKHGKLSGFIHAAGIEKTMPIASMKAKDYENLFSVNVVSGLELAKIASKKKYVADKASFVYISSITAVIGRVGVVGYAATKGAIVAGARSMALELAQKGINVNVISPGTILTPMMVKYLDSIPEEEKAKRKEGFPLGLGAPEDVANTAIFLLSDAAKWITGQNIIVDGGYTAR